MGVLVGAVSVSLLVGCGAPAGDGELVDDWAAVVAPKAFVPPPGACFDSSTTAADSIGVIGAAPVPCDRPHAFETYHVGQFPAEVAARNEPPRHGSPEYLQAFADCTRASAGYLGEDWINGRLYVLLTPATGGQWQLGARHFRCDLAEVRGFRNEVVKRTASLRDGLRGERSAASRCFEEVPATGTTFADINPADCAQPHHLEYAGAFDWPGEELPKPGKARDDIAFPKCRALVAGLLGVPVQSLIKVAWTYWVVGGREWDRGDRRIRCYAAGPDDKRLVGSVRGIGGATPRTAG
jgi:Septum formation